MPKLELHRRLTILLHWSLLAMLAALLAGAEHPVLYWAFGMGGLAMGALALGFGLLSRPGPKLEGVLRAAHPWMHRAMYALLVLVCALTLHARLAGGLAAAELRQWYMILFSVAALHGIFHLWRHTALGDGALRRMTPKFLHHIL